MQTQAPEASVKLFLMKNVQKGLAGSWKERAWDDVEAGNVAGDQGTKKTGLEF